MKAAASCRTPKRFARGGYSPALPCNLRRSLAKASRYFHAMRDPTRSTGSRSACQPEDRRYKKSARIGQSTFVSRTPYMFVVYVCRACLQLVVVLVSADVRHRITRFKSQALRSQGEYEVSPMTTDRRAFLKHSAALGLALAADEVLNARRRVRPRPLATRWPTRSYGCSLTAGACYR